MSIYGRNKIYEKNPLLLLDPHIGGMYAAGRESPEEYHEAHVKAAAHNPWLKFLKKFRKEHPELTPKQAMKQASKVYKGGMAYKPAIKSAGYGTSRGAKKGWKTHKMHEMEGENLWPFGHPRKHSKDAKKGWKKRGGLEAGSFLDSIPIVGDIAKVFGLGDNPMEALSKEHKMMGEALAAGGLSAGSEKRMRSRMRKIEKLL